MQGYFLKLLGSYRSFIHPEPPRCPPSAGAAAAAVAGARAAVPAAPRAGGRAKTPPLGRASMPAALRSAPPSFTQQAAGPAAAAARSKALAAAAVSDPDAIRGSGYVFDHAALVASHRRDERARAFLQQLRQSQMYEVFVQERLAAAAACGYGRPGASASGGRVAGAARREGGALRPLRATADGDADGGAAGWGGKGGGGGEGWPGGGEDAGGGGGGWDEGGDPFEERVSAFLKNRSHRLAVRAGAGPRSSLARFQVGAGKGQGFGRVVAAARGLGLAMWG
jgi:hypothetical protein